MKDLFVLRQNMIEKLFDNEFHEQLKQDLSLNI